MSNKNKKENVESKRSHYIKETDYWKLGLFGIALVVDGPAIICDSITHKIKEKFFNKK